MHDLSLSDSELLELAVEQDAGKCPNDGAPLQAILLGSRVCLKCSYHESEDGTHARRLEISIRNEYVPPLLELIDLRARAKLSDPVAQAITMLTSISDDDRAKVLAAFCLECGAPKSRAQPEGRRCCYPDPDWESE